MERAIVSNIYDKKLISYRDVADAEVLEQKRLMSLLEKDQFEDETPDNNPKRPIESLGILYLNLSKNNLNSMIISLFVIVDTKSELEESGAHVLQLLWSYRCESTRGRPVSNVCLNKANEVNRIFEACLCITYKQLQGYCGYLIWTKQTHFRNGQRHNSVLVGEKPWGRFMFEFFRKTCLKFIVIVAWEILHYRFCCGCNWLLQAESQPSSSRFTRWSRCNLWR